MAQKIIQGSLAITDTISVNGKELTNSIDFLAPTYDSSLSYNIGDLVIYNNILYSCKEDNVTGAWDSTKWDETTIAESVLGILNTGV